MFTFLSHHHRREKVARFQVRQTRLFKRECRNIDTLPRGETSELHESGTATPKHRLHAADIAVPGSFNQATFAPIPCQVLQITSGPLSAIYRYLNDGEVRRGYPPGHPTLGSSIPCVYIDWLSQEKCHGGYSKLWSPPAIINVNSKRETSHAMSLHWVDGMPCCRDLRRGQSIKKNLCDPCHPSQRRIDQILLRNQISMTFAAA